MVQTATNLLPLGINLRNRIIRTVNRGQALLRANDKLETKKLLEVHGIAVPKTYMILDALPQRPLTTVLPERFALKPTHGSRGKGILVLHNTSEVFQTTSGRNISEQELRRHIRRALDGDFSPGSLSDTVLIEEVITPSNLLSFEPPVLGLPDIRIVCFSGKPVMAMLRYPTLLSDGKANLCAGALGLAIDLSTGALTNIHSKVKQPSEKILQIPPDFVMPFWKDMLYLASKTAELSELTYTGIDLVLNDQHKILVLEVNGRPGLEIQNVNKESLLYSVQTNCAY